MKQHHLLTSRPLFATVVPMGLLLVLASCGTQSTAAKAPAQEPGNSEVAAAPASPKDTAAVGSDAAVVAAKGCSVVTQSDVSTTLGEDPGAGLESLDVGGSGCHSRLSSGDLTINVSTNPGCRTTAVCKDDWESARNGARHTTIAGSYSDLNGVGDEAYANQMSEETVAVSFYKGHDDHNHADVHIMLSGTSTTVATATALSKIAAGRL